MGREKGMGKKKNERKKKRSGKRIHRVTRCSWTISTTPSHYMYLVRCSLGILDLGIGVRVSTQQSWCLGSNLGSSGHHKVVADITRDYGLLHPWVLLLPRHDVA
jgi:hypothetical protein